MFQNHLILAIWTCLQALHPVGRDAIARLFERMFVRGLLIFEELDDLSLLLLIVGCPTGSFRAEADAAFVERELHLPGAVPALRESLRRTQNTHSEEALDLFRCGTAQQRAQAIQVLLREHGPKLRLFFGRLFLTAPVDQWEDCADRLNAATENQARMPSGTMGILEYLCRTFVVSLALDTIPTVLPHPVPSWYAALSPLEQRFLEASAGLPSRNQQLRVYLCVFARLDLAQMAVVESDQRTILPDHLAGHLENALAEVLDHLP